ncbi:MAG TPA: diguanylate cyclase [Myxococcales bacterium]|nr:diguanylate cyclase [Myxococcales bacterium]
MARTGRAQRWAAGAALPVADAALCVLLLSGAFRTRQLLPWALLLAAGLFAAGRWGLSSARRPWQALEDGLLCAISVLALAQLAPLLQPLMYLLGAAYVLALPLPLALPLLGALLALDAALTPRWPDLLAHASFTALFASLYHALLGGRLLAARRAERLAVRRRVADAEERARELRLVAVSDAPDAADAAGRHLLAGVAEVEEVLRSALAVAQAALRPHAAAVFLLSPEGDSVRLRECACNSEEILPGPLPAKEGALGAVLSARQPLRLDAGGAQLTYYQGRPPVPAFCGAPLTGRDGALIGALIADRETAFSDDELGVLAALGAEVTRAVEGERLLGAVRREKEEKARFFRALEELNKVTTLQQAADTAVAQATQMCPALHLCALTVAEDRRHRVLAVAGEAGAALRDLSFADNAGLVSNVIKLGAPLPGRALGAMDRVVIFDGGTVVRGLGALKIFPLKAGEATVGTLVCGSRRPDGLPEAAQKELAMLALQAAEALVRTRLYEQAERMATTDGLTGLLNRRTFNSLLEKRLREAQRYGRPLSLLLLDIDHFKKVNDTHGHPAGDAVLRGVAQVAQKQARETDLVARYGGEEMALILPETDARGAWAIAERIRKAVAAAAHATEQGSLRVTLSVGVATWTGGGDSPDDLLQAADKALYRAKEGGRNRVEAANPASTRGRSDLRSVNPGSLG